MCKAPGERIEGRGEEGATRRKRWGAPRGRRAGGGGDASMSFIEEDEDQYDIPTFLEKSVD